MFLHGMFEPLVKCAQSLEFGEAVVDGVFGEKHRAFERAPLVSVVLPRSGPRPRMLGESGADARGDGVGVSLSALPKRALLVLTFLLFLRIFLIIAGFPLLETRLTVLGETFRGPFQGEATQSAFTVAIGVTFSLAGCRPSEITTASQRESKSETGEDYQTTTNHKPLHRLPTFIQKHYI
jgi:hypothetical protein